MKSPTTIRKALRELRVAIENDPDPAVQRIAYGMETVIRWVIRDTVGWKRPADEARMLAVILREELRIPAARSEGSK